MESWILVILVILPGVWCGAWRVTFENQCALKGTSVFLKCEYDYPSGHVVTSVNWYKSLFINGKYQLVQLSRLPSPPDFEYVGNYWSDCSLKINNVRHTDEGAYYFGFKTTFNKWTSRTSAHLSVKELTAFVQPSTVREGDNVSLTCVPPCPATKTAVWVKDGQPLPKPVFQARREDAGNYYCAVQGQESAISVPVALNVQYAPRKVTLSVSPLGDIIEGSSLAFTCSSDANPPVTGSGYSLFKDGQFISSGDIHTIHTIQPSHIGLYYCQASNAITRSGIKLINSTKVHIDVKYCPMNVAISMNPPHVFEGNSVNLTCSCAANPAADNYTWYKKTNSPGSSSLLQVGSGQVLSLLSVDLSHTGLYLCQAMNSLGENISTEVLLTMEGKKPGIQRVPILAGTGVSLFVTLAVVLFLFWRKQRTRAENKQTVFDFRLDGRGSGSAANGDQSDTIYANIHMFPSSPSPVTAAHNITSASQRNSNQKHDFSTSYEDEITYSEVTFKPKNAPLPHDINSRATQKSWSKKTENDNSVIYATLVNSAELEKNF